MSFSTRISTSLWGLCGLGTRPRWKCAAAYTLRVGTDSAPDADLLPETTHVDIMNYLVLSTSYVSCQQMKAYKSLEAHNYFTSGWVKRYCHEGAIEACRRF